MNRPAEQETIPADHSILPAFLIWLTCSGWSLLRIPVPGVNEPHYLSKGRHFWNPDWCPGDFFLDSSNPHWVFYSTFGWLADVCTLPVAAVVGRLLGLLVLAWGWQQLALGVTGRRWVGLLSLPVLLMLQSLGNFSGEWLVGGIEAKVPSYGFLFWGLGDFLRGRFLRSACALGLAISLHPLVGIWGVIALGMTMLLHFRQHGFRPVSTVEKDPVHFRMPEIRTWMIMGILCTLLALPGVIPALGVVGAESPRMELFANQLQVADRLAHHLDPMQFPKESYRYWGLLIVLWLLLSQRLPATPQQRWWKHYVLCTVLIALIGIAVGWGPRPVDLMPGYAWRLKLLKFYFFRLGDQFVPVALSLCLTVRCLNLDLTGPDFRWTRWACLAGLGAATLGAFTIPFPDANPSRMTPAQQTDWQQACRWIRENSAPGDFVYATDTGWAIKWYAQRPEYVSFKDMPQDAASVVEWNHRLWVMARWRTATMEDGQATPDELSTLREQTGIRYFICGRFGPVAAEPVYANGTFRVYELPNAD